MVLRKKLTVLLMTVMLVVMSAAPAMADKGGDPPVHSWGYGSSVKKECKESGGTYFKGNRAGPDGHAKIQVCSN